MNKTNIEWVKNPDGTQGYTWNPITGCLNHTNGLCKGGGFPCYAYSLAHGRLKSRYLSNWNVAPIFPTKVGTTIRERAANPFYPRLWQDRIDQLIEAHRTGHRIPKGVFVCDMSDLFGIGIPEEWTDNVLYAIKKCPTWRFYLLTKQPQNLPKWSPFPDNCWVGVTACNAKMAEEAGFWLWEVKARVKFISFEPLLERIQPHFADYLSEDVDGIKWVIIGAQTKPYKPPRKEWIDEIVDAADRAKIPVFLKDNLRPALQSVYGKELPMRQEMPL